jgi:hypothetical protein
LQDILDLEWRGAPATESCSQQWGLAVEQLSQRLIVSDFNLLKQRAPISFQHHQSVV